MIIYKVTNLVNEKVYIGKTVQSLAGRKNKHLYDVRNNSNYLFHRAIRKYGEENFTWEIIDKCLFDESLTVLEKHYIKEFHCITPKGYNLTEGGEGSLGFKHSPESIKKMMGHGCSDETRKKISESSKNRKHSDETKRKISMAGKGRIVSAETRAKMSAKAKGHKRGLGRKFTPERCAQMSASRMGHAVSLESRAKISAARIRLKMAKVLNVPLEDVLRRSA